MSKINYKILFNLILILLIVNPIFGGNNPDNPVDNSQESSGFFGGFVDGIKQAMLTPARSIIDLYNENVDIYLELISPFQKDASSSSGSTTIDSQVIEATNSIAENKDELNNLLDKFQFFSNVALGGFTLIILALLAMARDEETFAKAKHLGMILFLNYALFEFAPLFIEFAISFNFEVLYGSTASAAGTLYYYVYMLLYIGFQLWLNYILITSIFIGTNDEKYYRAKQQRSAFWSGILALAVSGIVAVIILKFVFMGNSMFSTSGIKIDATSDTMGWDAVFTGVFLGLILLLLSLPLLAIGYLVGILMGIGFILISITYVLKKTYGPAQAIGSYSFFSVIWLMFIPIAFSMPGYFMSMLFGGVGDGLTSQMVRAIIALLLGIIFTIVYIKMAGKMFFLIRFNKALSVFSNLRKATQESVSAMKTAGSKVGTGAVAVGSAAVGAGAATYHYASHPKEAVSDIGQSVSYHAGEAKNFVSDKVSSSSSGISNSFKSTTDTIATNYRYKNFSAITSKQDAKIFKELESKGISNLVNERVNIGSGSGVEKMSRRESNLDKFIKSNKGGKK